MKLSLASVLPVDVYESPDPEATREMSDTEMHCVRRAEILRRLFSFPDSPRPSTLSAVPEKKKKSIKASERVNVDVFTQNKRPCPEHSQTQFYLTRQAEELTQFLALSASQPTHFLSPRKRVWREGWNALSRAVLAASLHQPFKKQSFKALFNLKIFPSLGAQKQGSDKDDTGTRISTINHIRSIPSRRLTPSHPLPSPILIPPRAGRRVATGKEFAKSALLHLGGNVAACRQAETSVLQRRLHKERHTYEKNIHATKTYGMTKFDTRYPPRYNIGREHVNVVYRGKNSSRACSWTLAQPSEEILISQQYFEGKTDYFQTRLPALSIGYNQKSNSNWWRGNRVPLISFIAIGYKVKRTLYLSKVRISHWLRREMNAALTFHAPITPLVVGTSVPTYEELLTRNGFSHMSGKKEGDNACPREKGKKGNIWEKLEIVREKWLPTKTALGRRGHRDQGHGHGSKVNDIQDGGRVNPDPTPHAFVPSCPPHAVQPHSVTPGVLDLLRPSNTHTSPRCYAKSVAATVVDLNLDPRMWDLMPGSQRCRNKTHSDELTAPSVSAELEQKLPHHTNCSTISHIFPRGVTVPRHFCRDKATTSEGGYAMDAYSQDCIKRANRAAMTGLFATKLADGQWLASVTTKGTTLARRGSGAKGGACTLRKVSDKGVEGKGCSDGRGRCPADTAPWWRIVIDTSGWHDKGFLHTNPFDCLFTIPHVIKCCLQTNPMKIPHDGTTCTLKFSATSIFLLCKTTLCHTIFQGIAKFRAQYHAWAELFSLTWNAVFETKSENPRNPSDRLDQQTNPPAYAARHDKQASCSPSSVTLA
ncbi:hypothetical protein PR048_016745 [Dryococelus australis]|uniref:Uncharacterized protein n=1 Tax=Dryococelus australis TaxID=614101 RepID=A0ABQ9H7H8_9NEOP|nr:hypothetical protein PR048_016745 [Dryococelus australis]